MVALDDAATAKLIKQVCAPSWWTMAPSDRTALTAGHIVSGRYFFLKAHLRRTRPVPPSQVEFYFSDSNLPKDKFLKEKIAADPEGCE